MTEGNAAPYIDDIQQDVSARSTWNTRDNLILSRRLGKRKAKKRKPYIGAPNFVVPIIDDTVTDKTDMEISMILNAPLIAHFIPVDGSENRDVAMKAAKAFDTYLRHVINFRRKKEQLVDTKNARGISVAKRTRKKHPRWGVIADFIAQDPKDVIVPVDTKDPQQAERIVSVLRYSRRQFKAKSARWKGVKRTYETLKIGIDEDGREETGTTSGYDKAKDNVLKVTEMLIGINASDAAKNTIVVWEIFHYATEWDVKNDPTKTLEVGRKCVTYIVPDVPDVILHAIAWNEDKTVPLEGDELEAELASSLEEDREPVITITEKRDMAWPFIQHRAENRSEYWYDSRGIGHTCMDNQIAATGQKNAKMVWLEYASHPTFENDGTQHNPTNVKIYPGAVIPKGLKIATPPSPPAQLDFNIDAEKRDAGARAGSGASQYSAQVSERRKLEKTAAEVHSQDAKEGIVTSASVDRFNDADRELFQQLWDDLRILRPKLPIITKKNEFQGFAGEDDGIYDVEFLVVPAASSKTLNPDHQYLKASSALSYAMQFVQAGVAIDPQAGLRDVLSHYDPYFADIVMMDPNKPGPQGQPPVYMILQQMQQQLAQLTGQVQEIDSEVESVEKLSVETSQEVEQSRQKTEQEEAQRAMVP